MRDTTTQRFSCFDLDFLIEDSIRFLKEHEPAEGYFLGFSGGKDSICVKHLCKSCGVKFHAFYSVTGLDAPELCAFIRQYHPDVKWIKPPESIWSMIERKGPLNLRMQWCCDLLKHRPTKATGLRYKLMGIRAEESKRRAERGPISKMPKGVMLCPIFDWQEWAVWDYIERFKIPYPQLYDDGFTRLGCVVCPYLFTANMRLVNQARERWPRFYEKYETHLKIWYDRRVPERVALGKPVTPWDEFLLRHYQGVTEIKK